jgi:hypothetical protein
MRTALLSICLISKRLADVYAAASPTRLDIDHFLKFYATIGVINYQYDF